MRQAPIARAASGRAPWMTRRGCRGGSIARHISPASVRSTASSVRTRCAGVGHRTLYFRRQLQATIWAGISNPMPARFSNRRVFVEVPYSEAIRRATVDAEGGVGGALGGWRVTRYDQGRVDRVVSCPSESDLPDVRRTGHRYRLPSTSASIHSRPDEIKRQPQAGGVSPSNRA